MADGDFFAKPISKNEDNNAVANPILVQLSDGTSAIGVTTGALDVNLTNASLVVTATNLDIRDLAHATDSVAIGDGGSIILDIAVSGVAAGATAAVFPVGAIRDDALTTLTPVDGDYVGLRTDSVGALWVNIVDASVVVTATDLDIRDLTHVSDSVKIGDGTDLLAVNTDGSINVNIVSTVLADEFHTANVGSPAANTVSTQTKTATGGTMLVTQITVAGSGGVKYVVKNNAVEVMTGFIGRDGNTDSITFATPIEVASGDDFTIDRTNRQQVANDVYSSVFGRQL